MCMCVCVFDQTDTLQPKTPGHFVLCVSMTPLGSATGGGRWVSYTRPGDQETQRIYACTVINLINVLNLQDTL